MSKSARTQRAADCTCRVKHQRKRHSQCEVPHECLTPESVRERLLADANYANSAEFCSWSEHHFDEVEEFMWEKVLLPSLASVGRLQIDGKKRDE